MLHLRAPLPQANAAPSPNSVDEVVAGTLPADREVTPATAGTLSATSSRGLAQGGHLTAWARAVLLPLGLTMWYLHSLAGPRDVLRIDAVFGPRMPPSLWVRDGWWQVADRRSKVDLWVRCSEGARPRMSCQGGLRSQRQS